MMKLPGNLFASPSGTESGRDATETENMIRAALPQAYVAANASPDLRQRVAEMAVLHDERQVMQPARRPRLLLKLAMAGMIAAALPLYFVWPRLSTALLLYRVQTAILRTHNVHFVTWTYAENGKSTRDSEVWYRNGMWRVERQGSKVIEVYSGGRGFAIDVNTHTVKSLGVNPPAYDNYSWSRTFGVDGGREMNPLVYDNYTGFHLRDTPGIAAQHGFYSHMEKIEQYMLAGQKVDVYRLHEPMYPQKRIIIEVDAKTHLPRRTLWSHEEHGRKVTERITVFNFEDPLTPGMFSMKINSPNGIQKIHFNESQF